MRGVVRLLGIVLIVAAIIPCYLVARPFGREGVWVRRLLRGVGHVVGLRVAQVHGAHPGPALYAANHISWLDILALGGAEPVRFIAKAEIARWPLIGWMAGAGGSVFVSRERRSATRMQADAVALALRGVRPVVLFAEGGTGDGVTLDPFRPALFAAAVETGVPVQAVAIDYGGRAAEIAWPDDTSFATEMKRILSRRGVIPVTLRFASVLDAAALDRKALAEAAHADVAAGLRRYP